jgi:hypothetical protein
MVSLKSTLVLVLGFASSALATDLYEGARSAIQVPCGNDELALPSQSANSTTGPEDASLEGRQSCGFGGTFFEQGGCSYSGSAFARCSGGAGCVLTNSVLVFGFQSIKISDLSCDLIIYNGDCNGGYSFYIPRGAGSGSCWSGFGTGHGYAVQC